MKRPIFLDQEFEVATAKLSAAELGALIRLALFYWTGAELPVGDETRARVAGVTPAAMRAIAPAVLPFFAPGGLVPILREASLAKTARRAAAGRASARSRWGAGMQPAA